MEQLARPWKCALPSTAPATQPWTARWTQSLTRCIGHMATCSSGVPVAPPMAQPLAHCVAPIVRRRRTARAGLRENILGSWTGAEGRPGVMLEDDVEVSALWWHWAQAGLRRYAHLPAVVGVSLFTSDDMNEAYENGGTNGAGGWEPSCGWQSRYYRSSAAQHTASAVLFGQPCSWGAVLLPNHWRAFLDRAHTLRRAAQVPELPCPKGKDPRSCKVVANRWGRNSWKRLLILHMVERGLVMAYPNLPGRTSFSTNHVEPGLHNHDPRVLSGQRARHTVPLVTDPFCDKIGLRCRADLDGESATSAGEMPPPFALPAADEIATYDFYCAEQPTGEAGFEAMAAAGEQLLAKQKLKLVNELPEHDQAEYVLRSRPAAAAADARADEEAREL